MGGNSPEIAAGASAAVARFAAAHLAALDDDALASLANKGLVRRARKDLEKAKPTVVGCEGAEGVLVEVEGSRVRVTTPVAKSTCACSPGICRHVLAAIMFLRESAAGAAPHAPAAAKGEAGHGAAGETAAPQPGAANDTAEALLALDDEAIQRWAGKPLFKKAAVTLARGVEIDESAPAVAVRLPAQNVTVRFIGAALDSILCSCHAPAACEHKVAALLAYRAAKTGRPLEVPQAMLEASAGAARTREEVRDSVRRTLQEMLALGTSRLSAATDQRLRTLAVSAHGVDLPRLERSLKTLADDVSKMLQRNAAASSASVLAGAARTAALVAALHRPTPAVVGEHRSTYLPISGTADIVGLGAARWRTRSGYHGLTVYFWEPAAKRWTGWSDARPVGTPGFDPVQRFDDAGPWTGAATPRQAAATRWRLSGAHRNAAGRIAARANTRGVPAGKSSPSDGPLMTRFADLGAVADSAFAPGLAEQRDHANLVLLAPAAWGEAAYDPVRQEVTRPVMDGDGHVVPLVLRHGPETEQALTTLQRADGPTLRAAFGFLRVGAAGLYVEPVTLWTQAKPIHLTLDNAPAATVPVAAAAAPPAPAAAEESNEEELEGEEESPEIEHADDSGLEHVLAGVESEVLAVAEGGVTVLRDLAPLRTAAKHLRAAGMNTLAGAVDHLCDHLDRLRKSTSADETAAAESLMRCAYAVRLAQDCATLSGAGVATLPLPEC